MTELTEAAIATKYATGSFNTIVQHSTGGQRAAAFSCIGYPMSKHHYSKLSTS